MGAKINTTTMQTWSTQISNINEEAKDILTSIEDIIKDIDKYWDGNSSNSFINATLSLTSKAKDHHISMKEASNILVEISNTMENQ